MKTSKSVAFAMLAIIAAYFSFSAIAGAALLNITVDPNTGLPVTDVSLGHGADYGVTGNFDFAVSDVSLYNSFAGSNLPTPVMDGFASYIMGNPGPVDLTGFDYAVLHYAKGKGGTSQVGGVEVFYLNGMTGDFTFPDIGLGPNGVGHLSTLRLFGSAPQSVPDSGSTMALLGISLSGLAYARRFIKR
ncbi:MAG: VPDSG-CTERM sorting domain-containing protein [Verrucomicrobiota bacterium]|nr:VPDSG-CTERM sorting domain-containing protein [Verrucomicrobiota bacterium]